MKKLTLILGTALLALAVNVNAQDTTTYYQKIKVLTKDGETVYGFGPVTDKTKPIYKYQRVITKDGEAMGFVQVSVFTDTVVTTATPPTSPAPEKKEYARVQKKHIKIENGDTTLVTIDEEKRSRGQVKFENRQKKLETKTPVLVSSGYGSGEGVILTTGAEAPVVRIKIPGTLYTPARIVGNPVVNRNDRGEIISISYISNR